MWRTREFLLQSKSKLLEINISRAFCCTSLQVLFSAPIFAVLLSKVSHVCKVLLALVTSLKKVLTLTNSPNCFKITLNVKKRRMSYSLFFVIFMTWNQQLCNFCQKRPNTGSQLILFQSAFVLSKQFKFVLFWKRRKLLVVKKLYLSLWQIQLFIS